MTAHESDALARSTADAVARRSYGKLVAFLAARTHDVALAEDALSEAFASALSHWPIDGTPANPEGWLLTVARRKLIDAARAWRKDENASDALETITDGLEFASSITAVPDQRLALMFACAHPAIDPAIRAPLILQVVLGLDAATIASAFLVAPAAMGQRLVRAKNKIRVAGIPFRIPEREELPERLETVLDAIYAGFAEGWVDAAGTDAARRDLAEEAIFLGKIVTELLPDDPEALGLLALMLHAEARRSARRKDGDYIPLSEQDPRQWNASMITEAEALLLRASSLGRIGRFQLEAAIQSAHVHRRITGTNNWAEVVQLYDALFTLTPSPVVVINRAIALAEAKSPAGGLDALAEIASDPRIAEYQPYWAARAELLSKTGSLEEARHAYEIAIGLERDDSVRRFLQQRQLLLGG